MEPEKILLIYDKQCPVCDNYAQAIRIRQSFGVLKVINARENTDVLNKITARGFDIDQGIILKVGEKYYYGAEAVHTLALISSRSGLFNRFNYWLFRSRFVSRLIYPVLRFFRGVLLKILGKRKINNPGKENNSKF